MSKLIVMRKLILFFAFIICGFYFSQGNSFVYEVRYKPNSAKDSIKTLKAVLDIKDNKSFFRTENQKKDDSIFATTGIRKILNFGFEEHFFVEKNSKTKEINKIIISGFDYYSLKITENFSWKVILENRKIGDFDCQRAELDYGGRKWIAWFTTDIPFQDGPYVFQGLPGLIVEIKDEKNNFLFSLNQVKKGSEFYDTKANKITINWKTMDQLRLNFYNDPYKDFKPNSAGNNFSKIKYTDEHGNEILPDFKEWTANEQKKIKENNNPIELNHIMDYK